MGCKSVKELQAQVSFFTDSFNASKSMYVSQKYHSTDREARLYRTTQGQPILGWDPTILHPFSLFSLQKNEGTRGGGCVWIARITCFHLSGSFVLTQKQKG
jgi:hypothetical protein